MVDCQDILRPGNVAELREVVAQAAAGQRAIEVRAGGSKRAIGRPGRAASLIDMSAFTGIVSYEPTELVLTVRPATPLAEIEALLASRGQMLAFEPWDHGPLFGQAVGKATIGGIVAAGVAGSRRVSAGGARDHLLGFSAVSGRAEVFKGGGKVVKNVTGYDVSKVIAGSWGQLAVMTELTLKVVPRPKATATLALAGLSASAAVQAMAKAFGSPAAPAAAAHVPYPNRATALTAIRIEGFPESVAARAAQLTSTLADFAPAIPMTADEAEEFWTSVRDVRAVADEALWRVHVAPSHAATLMAALEQIGASWLCDWAGALVWAGAPASADIRGVAHACGAHAMLMRGPIELRGRTPARQPEAAAVAALSARLKQAFDPAGILDPQRFD